MSLEARWQKQGEALRDPHAVLAGDFSLSGISKAELEHQADAGLIKALAQSKSTLLVSREYENLVLALRADKNDLAQSFFHLPHPSGIAVKGSSVYIAATRNPNQIFEFRPTSQAFTRDGIEKTPEKILMPSRSHIFAGAHYIHDLAFIGNKLYGNAVGLNAVVEIPLNGDTPKRVWWPKSVEKNNKPREDSNHIQLNSIAAGTSLATSFFSASGAKPLNKRPGDPLYPVDKHGVIFSGKTREVCATGLTRPHSARLHKGKIYVANSGYGEVGIIEHDVFVPKIKLNGWTRGLHISGDTLFVGVSRVLPRFHAYAPGIDPVTAESGIYAISLPSWDILGTVRFPAGNQIFAIETISSKLSTGFYYTEPLPNSQKERDMFSTYRV